MSNEPDIATLNEDESPAAIVEGLVREVQAALEADNRELVDALTEQLHPADFADLLERLPHEWRGQLIAAQGQNFDADVFSYMDDTVRDELLQEFEPENIGAVISELETDDAVDILADLEDDDKAVILENLPQPDRAALEQSLAYPEDSAGRLMQRSVVVVPDYWVVGQTIDYLRATDDLPDEFYDIYIVDPRFQPVGSIPLSNVLRSRRGVAMRDLRMKSLHLIAADTDQEDVAYTFRQYGLVSAPVVDDSGRLLGVITVDDVVDVIHEEAEDDILKLGGVQEAELFRSPFRTALQRLPWLFINLGTAVAASMVIAQFDDAIEKVVALAVLMPIVASMGGNAGTQTLTVTVRALAIKELTTSRAWRMLGKELLVSLMNSFVFLIAGFVLAVVWFGDLTLAAVFGAAMIACLLCAGIAGMTIPLAIEKFGWDPAVSSGVFLTTVTDVVGFFAFLGLAVLVLM